MIQSAFLSTNSNSAFPKFTTPLNNIKSSKCAKHRLFHYNSSVGPKFDARRSGVESNQLVLTYCGDCKLFTNHVRVEGACFVSTYGLALVR